MWLCSGKDSPDDYDSDANDEEEFQVEDDEGIFSDDVDVSAFQDKYQWVDNKTSLKLKVIGLWLYNMRDVCFQTARDEASR